MTDTLERKTETILIVWADDTAYENLFVEGSCEVPLQVGVRLGEHVIVRKQSRGPIAHFVSSESNGIPARIHLFQDGKMICIACTD